MESLIKLLLKIIIIFKVTLLLISNIAYAQDSQLTVKTVPGGFGLKQGASLYRTCYYCHSLLKDTHITGPSLANIWGKPAGTVGGFNFYSNSLKNSKINWNSETLSKFLSDPSNVIPGTTMTFHGFKTDESIESIISFLKIALSNNGYQKVLNQKLIDQETAQGQIPTPANHLENKKIVTNIIHCNNGYTITFKDNNQIKYWELNIDFKVNSSKSGPEKNKPVILPTGSMGDRFTVFFKSTNEMLSKIKSCK